MAFTVRPTAKEDKTIGELMATLGKARKTQAVMAAAAGYLPLLNERNALVKERDGLMRRIEVIAQAERRRRAGLEEAETATEELERLLDQDELVRTPGEAFPIE